jgi:hypothetical protein
MSVPDRPRARQSSGSRSNFRGSELLRRSSSSSRFLDDSSSCSAWTTCARRRSWLGHISVRERGGAESMATRFVELGAMRLGPAGGAGDFVVLRDPGGAIVP